MYTKERKTTVYRLSSQWNWLATNPVPPLAFFIEDDRLASVLSSDDDDDSVAGSTKSTSGIVFGAGQGGIVFLAPPFSGMGSKQLISAAVS